MACLQLSFIWTCHSKLEGQMLIYMRTLNSHMFRVISHSCKINCETIIFSSFLFSPNTVGCALLWSVSSALWLGFIAAVSVFDLRVNYKSREDMRRFVYCKVVLATSLMWVLVDVFLLLYFSECNKCDDKKERSLLPALRGKHLWSRCFFYTDKNGGDSW